MLFRGTKLHLALGLLLAASSISGCPHQTIAPKSPEAVAPHLKPGRVYEPRESFSILPPAGYHSEGQSQWHFMKFLGPCEGDFTVNFNVRGQDDDGTAIEDAGPKAKGVLDLFLRKYKRVEEGFTHIGTRTVYYSCGTFEWDGKTIKNLQYFIRGGNGRVYVITFASPIESFPQHRPVFEKTAKSVLIQ